MESTAALRKAAPNWSLAGDKQLLDVLQNIHQNLMTQCQETNQRLEQMATALDDTSVDLQNVNNKFMAMRNSQFIESRVYDDDADILTSEPPKETPKEQEPVSEISMLKASVKILQSMHEEIQIVDSDSESDSEEDVPRTVLKPKDLYQHRPLPYIIGSDAWKAKWHAGLIVEDSDSDSLVSKRDDDMDQYSDSEPESPVGPPRDDSVRDNQESTTSSEMPSYQEYPPVSKPTQAEVAAEIARRLRGSPPRIMDPEPDFTPSVPTKVYRVEQPATTTIFSDEPPPLDQYESDEISQQEEEDDDIFAELHRGRPSTQTSREQSLVAQELFSGLRETKITHDLNSNKVKPQIEKQTSVLFQEDCEPELFAAKPLNREMRHDASSSNMENVKKPIGGISVFGSNKGTESIAAAILKRNQRKSSSDEDSTRESAAETEQQAPRNTEKDIFNDLFSKPKTKGKPPAERESSVLNKEPPKKVDLFSDNLFDDIDDIFTTNIKPVSDSNKPQKSIFDDDNLFADVAVTKKSNIIKSNEGKKSLFDSDDDLFSENVYKSSAKPIEKRTNITNVKNLPQKETISKNANHDDDVDNELFSKSVNETEKGDKRVSTRHVVNLSENSFEKSINDNIVKTNEVNKDTESSNKSIASNVSEISKSTKSIFDDSDSDGELFSTSKIKYNKEIHQTSTDITAVPNNTIKSSSGILNEDDNSAKSFKKSMSTISYSSENNNNTTNQYISQSNNINNNRRSKDTENSKLIQSTVAKNNSIPLFDDNDSDDIFNKKPIANKRENSLNNDQSYSSGQTNTETSLFGDDDFGDNLFAKSSKSLSTGEWRKTNGEDVSINCESNESNYERNRKSNSVFEVTGEMVASRHIDNNNKKENHDDDLNKSPETENGGAFQDSCNSNSNEDQGSFVEKPLLNEGNQHILENVKEQQQNKVTNTLLDKIATDNFSNNTDNSLNESLDNSLLDALKAAPTSNDIFGEILIEPPAFEKTTEPKKSRNVNALFDDDSDDESLFFKRNDPTFDEKPQINTIDTKDALFGIFHDEPPAIDVDFEQKSKITNQLNVPDFNKDLFGIKTVDNTLEENTQINDELFKTLKKTHTSVDKSLGNNENVNFAKSYNNEEKVPATSQPDTLSKIDTYESKSCYSGEISQQCIVETPDNTDSKRVGKLKNMNINIDVNSLLPGITLKKRSLEQIDGQVFSSKSQENLHSKYQIESTIVKSVSFDGKPGSQVLDNKISKERAKIQVKRRPSTRRARKEAVRKSAIDVGDDSTDNSSSIDDMPKPLERFVKDINKDNTNVNHLYNIDNSASNKVNSNETKSYSLNNEQRIDIKSDVENKNYILPCIDSTLINSNKRKEDTSTVKSKVVYVLNDEDIFSTAENTRNDAKTHTSSNLFDDIVTSSGDTDEKPVISTLGSIYDKRQSSKGIKNTESIPKKSLFDDSSDDEELFNKPKNISNKPKSILDSDSDEDLFGGNRRKSEKILKKVEEKQSKDIKLKVDVKGSLFGDDDDGDDLFGAKARTDSAVSKLQEKIPKGVAPMGIKPVLEDPLSLLDSSDE